MINLEREFLLEVLWRLANKQPTSLAECALIDQARIAYCDLVITYYGEE